VNDETLKSIIERAVRETLARCDGNKSDAARRLGISRTRLQRLLAGQSRAVSPIRERSDDRIETARAV
jgi:DNA-binding NtrC family response regulator